MNKILRLEITDRCNMKCEMCWSKDWKHEDMTFDELKKIIIEYKNHEPDGVVVLTSREPLMSKNFSEVLKLCTELGLDIKILSNCTLLSPKICEEIMNSNVSFISTSIHGNINNHDAITKVPGSYNLTVKGLKLLDLYRKKYNKENFEIRITTLFRKTLLDDIDSILDLSRSVNASLRIQHMMWHSERNKKLNREEILERYSYDDNIINDFPNYSDISGKEVISIIDKVNKYNSYNKLDFQTYPELTNESIVNWYDSDKLEEEQLYCNHPSNSIRVRSNGDVTFCQYIDKTFGNLKNDSLAEVIYMNDEYNDMCHNFETGKVLQICKHCCHCRERKIYIDININKKI